MLTRCPACQTTFKVTPEQLKLRAGKVRCGKCQSVFNALDSLADAPTGTSSLAPAAQVQQLPLPPTAKTPRPPLPIVPQNGVPARTLATVPTHGPVQPALQPGGRNPVAEQIDLQPLAESAPVEAPANPEEVRDAAITHGLVAARETTEIPGYNKWAEGAFPAATNIAVPAPRPRWPFVLVSVLLIALLAGQAAHHYRAELAIAEPRLRPLLDSMCAALECDIPLPRHAEFVSIEASDLQSDAARGGALVLAATLKNRAPYAQAWPLLEVTLTDVQDNAVLRRVLQAADYLPAKADPTVFPPNAEIAVKLWLETQDVAAAGYRLYVFYP